MLTRILAKTIPLVPILICSASWVPHLVRRKPRPVQDLLAYTNRSGIRSQPRVNCRTRNKAVHKFSALLLGLSEIRRLLIPINGRARSRAGRGSRFAPSTPKPSAVRQETGQLWGCWQISHVLFLTSRASAKPPRVGSQKASLPTNPRTPPDRQSASRSLPISRSRNAPHQNIVPSRRPERHCFNRDAVHSGAV